MAEYAWRGCFGTHEELHERGPVPVQAGLRGAQQLGEGVHLVHQAAVDRVPLVAVGLDVEHLGGAVLHLGEVALGHAGKHLGKTLLLLTGTR